MASNRQNKQFMPTKISMDAPEEMAWNPNIFKVRSPVGGQLLGFARELHFIPLAIKWIHIQLLVRLYDGDM